MEKRKVRLRVTITRRCYCRRIKRNFPFGKNSQPRRHCKDCGRIISAKEIRSRIPVRRRIV